jgi:NodT family efflux transporter outer membrane factor (OMF) lipoprotein
MQRLNTALLCAGCLCALVLTGCKVGPDYRAPKSKVPAAWVNRTADANSSDLSHWWKAFNDPNLSSLIERAVQSNLDLKQARLRVVQARAARGVVESGLWPSLSATGGTSRTKPAGANAGNLFQAGLDAAWEIDIFGGTRRGIESAEADIQAAVEDQRDVMVTLVSEVGLNYVQLRSLQQQIIVTRKNLEAQQHSGSLTRQRYNAGLVSALDIANSDALTATTTSQLPVLENSLQQTIYALSVLLGQDPGALVAELMPEATIPSAPPAVPAGLPSDLLRRRPDIRRAEAQLHSATAQIGVATADLVPKFSLTGSTGYHSDKLKTLVRSSNNSWSVGGVIDWQLFSAGRVQANIYLQKAVTEESLLTYQKAVLTALQDVENSLVAYAKEEEHRKALMDAVTANRKAVKLSMQLYTEGLTNFLSVIDAQRSLYSAENALVQSTSNLSTDLISLYKALGGGWQEE